MAFAEQDVVVGGKAWVVTVDTEKAHGGAGNEEALFKARKVLAEEEDADAAFVEDVGVGTVGVKDQGKRFRLEGEEPVVGDGAPLYARCTRVNQGKSFFVHDVVNEDLPVAFAGLYRGGGVRKGALQDALGIFINGKQRCGILGINAVADAVKAADADFWIAFIFPIFLPFPAAFDCKISLAAFRQI